MDYCRWSSSGTGQGEAKGADGDDDDDDDKSESDETPSLSYHTGQRYCSTGTGLLRARTTRQLVSLHVCTQ